MYSTAKIATISTQVPVTPSTQTITSRGFERASAVLVILAGVYSVVLLTTGEARSNPLLVIVCVLGVAGTWVLMVAIFAVEYMRTWAKDDSLAFPGDEPRTFRDFLYLSVQQSTTFSSSDVQIVRGSARSLAMVHSVVAFAYSTAIIAVFASLLIAVAG